MPTVGVLAEPPSLKRGIEEPCVRTKSSGSPRPKESLCSSCKDRKCHALRTQLQQPHSFLRSVLQRQNRTKIILSLPLGRGDSLKQILLCMGITSYPFRGFVAGPASLYPVYDVVVPGKTILF